MSEDAMGMDPPPPPARAAARKMFGIVQRRSGTPKKDWGAKYGPGRPDLWISRYIAVLILLALIVWSFYVVVGRVCTPMIRNDSETGLGVATGVGTMIGFVILWLVFVWSYLKILIVGPGFARDHCEKVPPPPSPPPEPEFIPYRPENGPAPGHPQIPPNHEPPSFDQTSGPIPSSDAAHSPPPQPPRPAPAIDTDDPEGPDPSQLAPITNLITSAIASSPSDHPSESTVGDPDTSAPPPKGKKGLKDYREVERPVPIIQVGPRWCRYCQINKPDRTHHCRHCGTCVLQFDHHCPWIGQCVGHHNHRFFMSFTLQASIFCAYILIFLVVAATKMKDLDGQVIGLIAVSALFGMFAGMMYCSHIYLIIKGLSTVESYKGRDQKEHENAALSAAYGAWLHNQEKTKVRRYWKEQWGGVEIDERWRWGGWRQMWEGEMGASWVGWILPLGRAAGDGLHFQANPRFGPNGEWLQKKDWPKELQAV